MFTGIVQGLGTIRRISKQPGLSTFEVELPATRAAGIDRGASISLSGVCLTVTTFEGQLVTFDLMHETLALTNLGERAAGDRVNIERSAPAHGEVGGHILSGHVDTTATIVAIDRPANNCVMTFKLDPRWARFVFSKGFIALDGCSLTVVNADRTAGTFQVWFIPETLEVTTFGARKVGDRINVEIERSTQVIVETVERVMAERFAS